MDDNQFYSVIWVCVAVVAVTIVSAVVYYNVVKPSENEVLMMVIDKYDLNPVVYECMTRDWAQLHEFEICRTVFENIDMDPEEAEKLRLLLHENMR